MIAVNFTTVQSQLKYYCDRVSDCGETVLVTRKADRNVVIINTERYNELKKTERNASYLGKLERGLDQVQSSQGIVKTMEELEVMAEEGI